MQKWCQRNLWPVLCSFHCTGSHQSDTYLETLKDGLRVEGRAAESHIFLCLLLGYPQTCGLARVRHEAQREGGQKASNLT